MKRSNGVSSPIRKNMRYCKRFPELKKTTTSSSSLKPVYEHEEQARNNNGKEQGEHQHPKLWRTRLQEGWGLEAFVTSRQYNRLRRVQFSLHRCCGLITRIGVSLHRV